MISDGRAESSLVPPVYGLVLVGGRSRRMGKDKALIPYHEEAPHGGYTAGLLSRLCENVFYSCRPDQSEDPVFSDWPKIPDAFSGWGPLAGVLSAQCLYRHAAFLVAACDLPFLAAEDLAFLLEHRNPKQVATAFRNPVRRLPEPLCAIYEPSFREAALDLAEAGCHCPTDILVKLNASLVHPLRADFLENANHPEDYERALALLPGKKVA